MITLHIGYGLLAKKTNFVGLETGHSALSQCSAEAVKTKRKKGLRFWRRWAGEERARNGKFHEVLRQVPISLKPLVHVLMVQALVPCGRPIEVPSRPVPALVFERYPGIFLLWTQLEIPCESSDRHICIEKTRPLHE